MQGLRGVGATLVLLNHFGLQFAEQFPIGRLFQQVFSGLSHLSLGSSMFIVISAYYSYRAFQRDPDLPVRQFLRRRARSILPLYWFVLAVYVVVALLAENRTKIPEGVGPAFVCIVANVFLMAPLLRWPPIITVSWTLTYIVMGYLMVPLFAQALCRLQLNRVSRMLVIIGVAVASRMLTPLLPLFLAYNDLLATGVLLYELQGSARFRKLLVQIGEAGTVAAFTLFAMIRGTAIMDVQFPAIVARMLFCTGIGTFCASRYTKAGLVNQLLASEPLQQLGRVSYSMYLSHGLSLQVVKWFVAWCDYSQWLFWILLLCSFIASVFLAALLDRLWRPAKRFFEDFRIHPRMPTVSAGR